jgi:hypothetical protein
MRLRSSYLLGGSVGEAALAVAGDKRAGDTTFLVRRMREGMKRNHTIFWRKRCDHQAALWCWWKSFALQTGDLELCHLSDNKIAKNENFIFHDAYESIF